MLKGPQIEGGNKYANTNNIKQQRIQDTTYRNTKFGLLPQIEVGHTIPKAKKLFVNEYPYTQYQLKPGTKKVFL